MKSASTCFTVQTASSSSASQMCAAVKNLAHSASLRFELKSAPSNPGIKRPGCQGMERGPLHHLVRAVTASHVRRRCSLTTRIPNKPVKSMERARSVAFERQGEAR